MPYRAGFWVRLLATAIDLVAMMILAIGAGLALDELESRTTFSIVEAGFDALVYMLWLIYTSAEVWAAGTPGKLLLRLRINNQDCTPAGFWRLVLRWSTKWLGMILSLLFVVSEFAPLYWLAGLMNFIVLIGCFAAANDDRLSWHDEWAATAVCYRPHRYRAFDAMVPPPLPPAQPPPTT